METTRQNIDPVAGLAASTENFFLLRTYEAVLRLKLFVREEVLTHEGRFLSAYEEEVRGLLGSKEAGVELLSSWRARLDRLQPGAADAPLRRLQKVGGPWGVDAFLIAGLPDEDSRFGALFDRLQASGSARRPSLELLDNVVQRTYPDAVSGGAVRRLVSAGFLKVMNQGAPRSEWLVGVPSDLWDAARGEDPTAAHARWVPLKFAPALDEIIAPDILKLRFREVADKLRSLEIRSVVIRGSAGSNRTRFARALAARLGFGTMALPQEALGSLDPHTGALCTIIGAIPLLTMDLALGETRVLDDIPGYSGPLIVTLGMSGGLTGPALEHSIELRLPWPETAERVRCWSESLGIDQRSAEVIDRRFTLPLGHIRTVAERASTLAALDGDRRVETTHVCDACRSLNRQLLDDLADPVPKGGDWQQLVVPAATHVKLQELELRCLYRERLNEQLGQAFRTRSQRGVRALFSGPSGTGKTLAAQILATELDVDLYRVNLAAVVDKYVGEMEKRLDRLLSVAEELDVVLLIDEGDSILGKRTSIRTANDRFANTGTNFLLQKLETYRGMVLVTSNAADAIDPGFERRMDLVVHFHPPGPAERLGIWHLHLPEKHEVDSDYLESVAVRCALTGGQIRNAALHAALLSMQAREPISRRHVELSIRSEYLKQGATMPSIESHQQDARLGMRTFVDSGVALA